MQYPAREDNPVSAVSLEHGSWEQETPPDPCSFDSWLRSSLPEASTPSTSGMVERQSWVMQQFLMKQPSMHRSPSMRSTGSAHGADGDGPPPGLGGGAGPGLAEGRHGRAGMPSGRLAGISTRSLFVSASKRHVTKVDVRKVLTPEQEHLEEQLRQELAQRRLQEEMSRRLEAKDAEERAKLTSLRKELKGKDYTYDHKGEVVILNEFDPDRTPLEALSGPGFKVAAPDENSRALSPKRRNTMRTGSNVGHAEAAAAAAARSNMSLSPTEMRKERDRRLASDFKKITPKTQPSAMETLLPAGGVTLRGAGGVTKTGPLRPAVTGLTRDAYAKQVAKKALQAQVVDGAGHGPVGGVPGTPLSPAPARNSVFRDAPGSTRSTAGGANAVTAAGATAGGNKALAKSSSGAGGSSAAAAVAAARAALRADKAAADPLAGYEDDKYDPFQGARVKQRTLSSQGMSSSGKPLTPDVNISLIGAGDWGSAGLGRAYEAPPSLPHAKPTEKQLVETVGRGERLPRDRAPLPTLAPPLSPTKHGIEMSVQDVNYACEVPAELLCAVCYHALRDPRCCPRCQKGFCAVCISTWGTTQKRKGVPFSCPYCRAQLHTSQLHQDEALAARVDALPCLCPFHANGCTGIVPRRDLPNHLTASCAFAPARCPDCQSTMPRGSLALHVGSPACPNRRVACPNTPLGCRAQLPPAQVAAHVASDCAFAPLSCRACGTTVLRGGAEEHVWAACPAACPCPNRAFGCDHVAPGLAQLVRHASTCRYSESSACLARLRSALGPAPPSAATPGGDCDAPASPRSGSRAPHPPHPHSARVHVHVHAHGHHPYHRVRRSSATGMPGSPSHAAGPSGPGSGSLTTPGGAAAAAGVWVHGLFVPAYLYPEGLPEPPQPEHDAGAEAEGKAGTEALPPAAEAPPWPWAVDSTREAPDAAAAAAEMRFGPAPDADRLRRQPLTGAGAVAGRVAGGTAAALVPEPYHTLIRALAGDDEAMRQAGGGGGGCEGGCSGGAGAGGGCSGPASASASAAASPTAARAAAASIAAAAPMDVDSLSAQACAGSLELPTADAFWWHQGQAATAPERQQHQQHHQPQAAHSNGGSGTVAAAGYAVTALAASAGSVAGSGRAVSSAEELAVALAHEYYYGGEGWDADSEAHGSLTRPAAQVYGRLLELVARLEAAVAAGPVAAETVADAAAGGRAGGEATGDANGADGSGLGGLPRPLPGSPDARLLEAYEGEDMTVLDLPALDTSLLHGYRAFWAVGLLRLLRRHWPGGPAPHWAALAVLNDTTTAVARRLLAAAVAVVGSELVQESAPMGEGDVELAVQSTFPPALAAEALSAVRQALHLYDDAVCEAPVWEHTWNGLAAKCELGLGLGRVACLVGQYTPLHGEFVRGEDDSSSSGASSGSRSSATSSHGRDGVDEDDGEADEYLVTEDDALTNHEGLLLDGAFEDSGHAAAGGGAGSRAAPVLAPPPLTVAARPAVAAIPPLSPVGHVSPIPSVSPVSPIPPMPPIGAGHALRVPPLTVTGVGVNGGAVAGVGVGAAGSGSGPAPAPPAGVAPLRGPRPNPHVPPLSVTGVGFAAGAGAPTAGVAAQPGGGGAAAAHGPGAHIPGAHGVISSLRTAMESLALLTGAGAAHHAAGGGAGPGGSGSGTAAKVSAAAGRAHASSAVAVAEALAAAVAAPGSPTSGGGSSGSSTTSSSSSGWESADEQEVAELLRQQLHSQHQAGGGAAGPSGGAAGVAAGGRGDGAPAATPPWWMMRRRMGRVEDLRSDFSAGGGSSSTSSVSRTEVGLHAAGRSYASRGSSDDSPSDADIRGVVALAAVLDWFATRVLLTAKRYVESGRMRLGACPRRSRPQLQAWHIQLVLSTSPLGRLLPAPQSAVLPALPALSLPPPTAAAGGGGGAGAGDGDDCGASLLGSLPLRPLARMLAALALQPTSALLLFASAGGAGAGGPGSAAASARTQARTPLLCPLDLRCYCGSELEAGGAPCSYWSGHQCAGCTQLTSRVRRLPFDDRIKLCGDVLRSAHAGAARAVEASAASASASRARRTSCTGGDGTGGGRDPFFGRPMQSQAPPHTQEAAPVSPHSWLEQMLPPPALHPPSDPAALATGGRVRGELLAELLPPPLRPLLAAPALAHAARAANVGLVCGLLRMHHLQSPCWWRQPSQLGALGADGTDGDAGGGSGGAGAQPPSAAAVSTALRWALRPHPDWLQRLQPQLLELADVEAAAALSRDMGAVLYSRTAATGRDGRENAAGAAAPAATTAGGAGVDGGEGGVLPLCIPRSAFLTMFEESWAVVQEERRQAAEGLAGLPAAFAVVHGAASSAGQAQAQGPGQARAPPPAGQRPVVPPAMGVAGGSAAKRRPLADAVAGPPRGRLRLASGQGGSESALGAGGGSASAAAAGGEPAVAGAAPRVSINGTAAAAVAAAGAVAMDVDPACCHECGCAEGDDAGITWSEDALELLHRAAEGALMDWLAGSCS
ncbi:hypothetical protein GPECTOR_49g504 [Gonium pectorale]|uniref:RING-type domain-containing protein n=1 Tax=Gonium pectorale TaxID=33097 RepID=A0A150G981_GONPE|nr:hypothetical protein GPECTOR_49g504 [Gonium pectorale]|eukprot:KXZ45920.1 hypothetical protein GPECTOR_49g504 [Gonium pectorale]